MVSAGRVSSRAWTALETDRSMRVKLGDRFRLDVDALRMVRSHPLAGVGVGCFESAFPAFMTFPSDLHWTHAHNDILEGMAETGLAGAVLILAALALFFRSAFRHLSDRLRQAWGWAQVGAAVGAVGLLCHSFMDFNLRIPANAAWFVVCLAVATHPASSLGRRRRVTRESASERNAGFIN
jgi:O-antigen ligase